MRFVFFFSFLMAPILSCSTKIVTLPTQKTIQGESGIDTKGFDPTTRAQDDFYQYANGRWIEQTSMPADKSSYGSFSIVGDKTEIQLREIVDELKDRKGILPGSDAQKVRDFYNAFRRASQQTVSIKSIQSELAEIDGIQNQDAFWKVSGRLSQIDVSNFIGVYIDSDMKNPDSMSVYLSQARLTLGDRDYYLKKEKRFQKGRDLLLVYIDQLSSVTGVDLNAKAILDLESKVAKIQWAKEENRDPKKRYNPRTMSALDTMPWKPILSSNGIPEQETYILSQPSFFSNIGKVVNETDLAILKDFLKFRLLNRFASILGKESFTARFEFARKGLRGVKEARPIWKRALSFLNWRLGEVLGKVYVERYFKEDALRKMTTLVSNLRKAYGQSIDRLDWMGEATKKEAQDKLSKFNPKIAYPKKWRDFSDLSITPVSAVENAKAVSTFELRRAVGKLGKPVDKSEWGMPPQIVNAYYNGSWNEIVFPAAVLQPPFFYLNADDAVNYGGIGAVIGHEIGHGFDDQGRKFDGDGVLRDWWTKDDAARFDVLKKKLAAQYNAFKVIDGLTINGEFTSGENIGDLGGLSIAYKAYHLSLAGKEAPIIDGMTGDQRFFMGWALVWRRLYTEEDLKRRLSTDPHSPSKARTNIILSNIDAFYVKEGDKMYLPPHERVQIW